MRDVSVARGSKGSFWLASRPNIAGLWSQAGSSGTHQGAARWYASLPPEEWPEEAEAQAQIQRDWAEPWGDRRQELVFIGAAMDEAELRAKLDDALLTEKERAAGPVSWSDLGDPFPEWSKEGA